ncbi:hypothetical protein [Sphingomonas sp. ERG5]|uniref:hypothetical protein n=1 Tax=Sphingomonas sp. ERG5 TaxID=1381597 RepID=UPI00054BAF5A|nr:hypothetical protein [Sphingomonas sp. ERG5]
MLLKRRVLDGIADGRITLVFRRWRRPTVKSGGTLTTVVGLLAIDDVSMIDAQAITERDAIQAGYDGLAALHADLASWPVGDLYRIAVELAGDDPRIALREDDRLGEESLAQILAKLARFDRASAWTRRTLDLIAAHPGIRAAELASMVGRDTAPFKANVRKLKALGLTESLNVGYQLSPRGAALHRHLHL